MTRRNQYVRKSTSIYAEGVTCFAPFYRLPQRKRFMAYFKLPESNPRTKQKEIASKRCGLRHTIFSVNGDKYTGEWLNDMKHGWILISSTNQHVP